MTQPGPAPTSTERLEQEIARLWAALNEQARKTLYSASIDGGRLTVRGSGGIQALDAEGDETFYVGGLEGAWIRPDGEPQAVVIASDDNSNWRLAVWDPDPGVDGYQQEVWAWDSFGSVILKSDVAGGLSRPWLMMPTVNVLAPTIPATNSAAYASTQSTGWVVLQQPRVDVQALLLSNAGGIGDARITINGTPTGSVMPIGAGTFAWTSIQTLIPPVPINSYIRVELQVRLTNGVGTVGGVLVATQRQSV